MSGSHDTRPTAEESSSTSPTQPETEPTTASTGSMTAVEQQFDRERAGTAAAHTTESEHKPEQTNGPAAVYIPDTCPECGSKNMSDSEKHAEITCDTCGEIVETREFPQTVGMDKYIYTMNERSTRVTSDAESGLELDGLGGRIDVRDIDTYGNSLTSLRRAKFHRLRKIDRKADSSNPGKEIHRYASSEINRMASVTSVPSQVQERARTLFKQILTDETLAGTTIETVATACFILACEESHVHRELGEIETVSKADASAIQSMTEKIGNSQDITSHSTSVTKHVDKFVHPLGLNSETVANTENILRLTLTEELLKEYNLRALTAAAVYAAVIQSRQHLSLERVASIGNVSVDDVKEGYKLIIESTH